MGTQTTYARGEECATVISDLLMWPFLFLSSYISTVVSIKTRGGAYIGETLSPRRNGRVDSVCLDGVRTKKAMGVTLHQSQLKTKLAENVITFALRVTMDNQMMKLGRINSGILTLRDMLWGTRARNDVYLLVKLGFSRALDFGLALLFIVVRIIYANVGTDVQPTSSIDLANFQGHDGLSNKVFHHRFMETGIKAAITHCRKSGT